MRSFLFLIFIVGGVFFMSDQDNFSRLLVDGILLDERFLVRCLESLLQHKLTPMIFSLLIGTTCHKVIAVTTIEANSQSSSIFSFPIWVASSLHFHLGLGGVLPKVLCIEGHILTMSNLDFIGVVHGEAFITIIFIPMVHNFGLESNIDNIAHTKGMSTGIFGILGGNFERGHLLHNFIGGHEMVVVSSL